MEVLLAIPQYKYGLKGLHLGLAYIASNLRANSISVKCIDASVQATNDEDCKDLIIAANPDIVGITCTGSNYLDAVTLATLAKQTTSAIVVVGGPQTTFTATESLHRHPEFDIIVRHEGEATMLELVNAIKSGEDLGKVLGIAFRDEGRIIETPDRPQLEDIDSLPFPARDLFKANLYSYAAFPDKLSTSMITARGCPHHCVFCTQSTQTGKLLRHRSISNVAEELEVLKYEGYEAIYFEDSTFTYNYKRTKSLCEHLRRLGFSWGCDTRIDNLNSDLIHLMANAGCKAIFFGVESMNPSTQEWIGKAYDNTRMKSIVANCTDMGIRTNCSLQAGFPGETIDTVRRDFESAMEIGFSSIDVSILTLYPGSELANIFGLSQGDYERASKYAPQEYHFHGMERVYFPGVTNEFINDVYQAAAEILAESWHSSGFYIEDSEQLGNT